MYKKILFLLMLTTCATDPNIKNVYKKELMFTVFDIVLYADIPKFKLTKHVNQVWDHLSYLEKEFSPIEKGFLGTLNETGFISKNDNPEIFDIVSNFIVLSKNISQKSDGAFDLTVYPLVRLWGFYIQDEATVPTQQEINDTLQFVGMDKISFTNDGIQLQPGVKLDLGAIAKGYAVDEAIRMLTNFKGIHAGIVNAGGNLRVFGNKPDNSNWKVGIRNPNGQAVEEIITLYSGEAIATSGDYEQYFTVNGKTYHHIFNPKTGYPSTHNVASASVIISNSAKISDVLATTILASGRDKGQKIVQELYPQAPMFFIERENDQLKSFENDFWANRKD